MKNTTDIKPNILIAEDEKAYSRALVLKLEKNGFTAKSAADGKEALALILKEKFDVLVLDLIMPKLNGFAVLEELKKINNTIPVIVLSNLNQEEDFAKVKALGARMSIEKSNTSISDIIKIIEDVLK